MVDSGRHDMNEKDECSMADASDRGGHIAFTPALVAKWCANHLTQRGFAEAKEMLHVNCDIVDGIFWSRGLIQDFCERFENGQLAEDEINEMKGEK